MEPIPYRLIDRLVNTLVPLAALMILGHLGVGAYRVHRAQAEGPIPEVRTVGKEKARVLLNLSYPRINKASLGKTTQKRNHAKTKA